MAGTDIPRMEGKADAEGFGERVRKALAEKPLILTEYGEVTSDRSFEVVWGPDEGYVLSGRTGDLILAVGDTEEELKGLYAKYRTAIDGCKEAMRDAQDGFLCCMQCAMCGSLQRAACYEMGREDGNTKGELME